MPSLRCTSCSSTEAIACRARAGSPPPAITAHDWAIELVLPGYGVTGGGLFIVMPSATFLPARVVLLRDFLVKLLDPDRVVGMIGRQRRFIQSESADRGQGQGRGEGNDRAGTQGEDMMSAGCF